MKRMNQEGPQLLGLVQGYRGPAAMTAAGAAAAVRSGAILLDLRGAESFAERHPLGALNLAHGPKAGYWAGWVLPADARVVLLAADERQAAETGRQLLRVGVSRIDGYISGGMRAWEAAGLSTASFPTMTVDQFHAAATRGEAPLVVDVRTAHEWDAGHIEGAVHIPLGELTRRVIGNPARPRRRHDLRRGLPLRPGRQPAGPDRRRSGVEHHRRHGRLAPAWRRPRKRASWHRGAMR